MASPELDAGLAALSGQSPWGVAAQALGSTLSDSGSAVSGVTGAPITISQNRGLSIDKHGAYILSAVGFLAFVVYVTRKG